MRYDAVFGTSVYVSMLVLMASIGPAAFARSQCRNHISMVPLRAMRAGNHPRGFTRFKYSLTPSDLLLIQSHEDTETSIGPYDLGFLIARDGKTLQSVTLRSLPEFRSEDAFFSQAFTTVAVTRACGREGQIYFVSMKYMGDELSPALVFVLVPSAQRYQVSALPMFSGGAVDISTADPLHLTVWNNLNEGSCNACKTPYEIRKYDIRDGKPVQIVQHRTRRLYSSDQFPESRIGFIP